MLVSSNLTQVPSVERLVSIWAERYLPHFSKLALAENATARDALRHAATPAGRAETVAKLPKHLVEEKCRLAAIRVKDIYDHLPEGCDLKDVVKLAQFATPVYLKLLDVYQTAAAYTDAHGTAWTHESGTAVTAWGIPKVDQLAHTLEPLLLDFQEQHMLSKDWRTLGFITTEINFSSTLLLEQLTPAEQVFLKVYFDFLEEQVALPWQRMCAAAARYGQNDPAFQLVEQMLPLAPDISLAVYQRACTLFPRYYGRRGSLDEPAVKHSSLRDLSMFQAYLWLAVLQGSLRVVEQELIALCIVVLEKVGVPWKMTAQGIKLLTEEILSRLNSEQRRLLQPYTDGMVQAFEAQ